MGNELLTALDTTPRTMAHLAAELHDEQLDQATAGEWSARDVLAHLRDLESLVMRLRLVRMLVEDDPELPGFDEDRWHQEHAKARDRKETLLGDFMLQRQASLNILSRLAPGEWERGGRHASRGPITVQSWVEWWVEHDRQHVSQFEAAIGETLGDVLTRRAHPDAEDPEEHHDAPHA